MNFGKYSVNDYFSWELYDKLPKTSGGTDIFYIGHNPLTLRKNSAWHL